MSASNPPANSPMAGREVIIELYQIGQAVKVSAMDSKTLIEISIQGPATASEDVLKQNAMKKLEYVLKKKGLL